MAKRRIVPPKIDNRYPNGTIKADRIAGMLGLPSVYYVFDTQSTTSASSYDTYGNGNPTDYFIIRYWQECPNCHAISKLDDAHIEAYLREENEVILQHCYRSVSRDKRSATMAPVTLHVRKYLRTCPSCKELYRDKMDDLRDGKETISRILKDYLKKASLQTSFSFLSKEFGVPQKVIQTLYKGEVAARDEANRLIPQPDCLGLYTLEFKDYSQKNGKTDYCLCVDEQRQTFIGFFPWKAKPQKEAFFNSIPDKSKVSYVFIYLDDIAAKECRKLFPNARVVVERKDVLERNQRACEEIFNAVVKQRPSDYYALMSDKDKLIHPEKYRYPHDSWYTNSIDIWLDNIPELSHSFCASNDLNYMYESDSFSDACDFFDRWFIDSEINWFIVQDYGRLLKRYRKNILEFILLYGTIDDTSDERKNYEQLLDAAESPMQNINEKNIADNTPARKASWLYLYGHIMYGTMDRVNAMRKMAFAQKLENTSMVFNYTFGMELNLLSYLEAMNSECPEYVSLDNFSIPLQELRSALNSLQEEPLCEEALMPLFFVADDDRDD